MKELLAYFVALVLGFTMLIAADLIAGMPLSQAVRVLTHSFRLITPIEYLLIPAAAVLPLFPVFKTVFVRRLKAKEDQSND